MKRSGVSGARLFYLLAVAWLVVVSGAVLYGLGRTARTGADLFAIVRGQFHTQTSRELSRQGLGTAVSSVLVRAPNGQLEPLNASRRAAILLFYHASCGACRAGMPRWLDLVLEARARGVPVYALSLDSTAAQMEFWGGAAEAVQLRGLLRREDVESLTGRDEVPTTAVVRDDRVIAVVPGAIGNWRRAFVFRELEKHSGT